MSEPLVVALTTLLAVLGLGVAAIVAAGWVRTRSSRRWMLARPTRRGRHPHWTVDAESQTRIAGRLAAIGGYAPPGRAIETEANPDLGRVRSAALGGSRVLAVRRLGPALPLPIDVRGRLVRDAAWLLLGVSGLMVAVTMVLANAPAGGRLPATGEPPGSLGAAGSAGPGSRAAQSADAAVAGATGRPGPSGSVSRLPEGAPLQASESVEPVVQVLPGSSPPSPMPPHPSATRSPLRYPPPGRTASPASTRTPRPTSAPTSTPTPTDSPPATSPGLESPAPSPLTSPPTPAPESPTPSPDSSQTAAP